MSFKGYPSKYYSRFSFIAICGQSIINLSTQETVNLTSPNYPEEYFNNINCVWHFYATDTTDGVFHLQIREFDLNYNWYSTDFLTIGGGSEDNVVASLESHSPDTVTVSGTVLRVHFQTDERGTGTGFLLLIQRISDKQLGR